MANENIQELKFQVGEAWKGVYSSSTAYGLANVVQDATGLSIYRSLKSGNVGHPVSDRTWWFCIIDMSSIKSESDRIAALNQTIAQDEVLRVAAEELRQQHEAQRISAETQRNEAEQNRISAEQARVNAESARATAEQQRITAEQGRVSAESARVQAEQARVLAETLRANAEDQRAANEQNRVAAEQQRIERAEQDHQRAESDHATYVDSLGAFDISSYHATDGVLAKYADLTAALGTNGANIPDDLRKGGMSVKFVQSSDNKYVQYRLISDSFNTTVANWQGVDDEPTAGSDNLVKSGGIAEFGSKIKLPYILNEGAIVDDGTIANITGYHHTSHLPIIDGYGYEIWGASNIPVYCYSEPKFESSCFLGLVSANNALKAGTKYVAYRFEDANVDYTNLEIVSKKDIDAAILGTPLMVHYKNYNTNDNAKSRKANINLIKNNIRELYFYGSDVDRTAVYHFFVNITSTEVRFIIYDTASRLDKRVNIASNKVVDVLLTQGNYNLRIVADFTNITLDGIGIITNWFVLSPLAFNAANIPLQNEKRINAIEEELEDISDNISVQGVNIDETDVTNYYDTHELGYILASNGQKVTAGQTSSYCTDYIPTNGAFAIKTLCVAGSGSGGAFYSAKSESSYISGFTNTLGANGKDYVIIPTTAKYFRTSMSKTDYDNGKAIIVLRNFTNEPLVDFLQYVKPRNTKVLFGYKEFVEGQSNSSNVWSPSSTLIDGSRQNLTLAIENDNARQIWSKDRFYLSRSVFEISLKVNDADSFFSVGATEGTILNELRVHNVSGVGTMEIYVGADSFDTYESITPTVVTSKAMSFNIIAGGEYKLGFRRIENETYNNIEHMDGVEYYMINLADGTKESIFIPRDSAIQNGVRNGLSTLVEGYRFISLKVGDIEVYNMFVSSMYAPQAKAMIIGDSYVDGDTLIGTDQTTGCGQKNKFACLLQSAISQTEFVVGGRGGERINANSIGYILFEITKFLPKYVIVELGINNSSSTTNQTNAFNEYKDSMEILIQEIQKLELIPVLMTIPPLSSKLTFVDLVNGWVRDSGYRYVDMNKAVTTDADGHTWNPDYVKTDGIHPTVLGHEAIYNAFVKELPELFAV